MDLQDTKNLAAELVKNAIETRVRELKEIHRLDSIEKQFKEFDNNPYNTKKYYIQFDEGGFLESVMVLDLPEWLVNEDSDVISSLLTDLADYMRIYEDMDEWKVSQLLGSPTVVNWNAGRNEYAIYSDELKLKVSRVVDENHAYLLIEQAMRKAGVFENIVSVDYHGQFVSFIDTKMGRLKDKTIEQRLKKYENLEE